MANDEESKTEAADSPMNGTPRVTTMLTRTTIPLKMTSISRSHVF